MQNIAIILSGPPLSGKTTWAKENKSIQGGFYTKVISRDALRMKIFSLQKYNDYKFSKLNEDKVTRFYEDETDEVIARKWDVIFDNTFCKEAYIIKQRARMKEAGYDVIVLFFDVPLWRLYIRNYIRYYKIGKWIPMKIIRDMKANHQIINRKDYEHLVYK